VNRFALFAALLFFSVPAYGQTDELLCQFWALHKGPSSAAYQPGVDVHGNPVVPADLNAQMPDLPPSRITFPITIDMAEQLNIPVPQGTTLDTNMGMVEVYTDGRILYKGQDMSTQAQSLCAKHKEAPPAPEVVKSMAAPALIPASTPPPSQEIDKDIIWGEGH